VLKGLHLTPDIWLSQVTGFSCWTVDATGTGGDLADSATHSGTSSFYSARVPVRDVATVRLLSARGFYVVDCSLTFTGPVSAPEPPKVAPSDAFFIRPADLSDATIVSKIAAEAMKTSRFHLDPWFPSETAVRVKSEWARNLVTGLRGSSCRVAGNDREPLGFIGTIDRDGSEPMSVIDLVAVAPAQQGAGIGSRLVCDWLRAACESGKRPIVGTQATNSSAVRFYEWLGFRLIDAHYVMHAHGAKEITG
jgi:GNAT superfamily N-acetyltransferase